MATVDDFADFAREVDRGNATATDVETRLRHEIRPHLADAGVVEHDARSRTARYREDPILEKWVRHVVERGAIPA